jgi:hypothetical protein
MENYVDKLLSLQAQVLDSPKASIPYGKLVKLVSIDEPALLEKAIKKLAQDLPFETSSWPRFGHYVEDWYMVELSEFKCNLLYCERGGYELRNKCANVIDLVFEILRIVAPSYTEAASTIAASLDHLADQRLLIWLHMSSEIFYMHQVNEYFGLRMATYNVTWMCEELVRMGVFSNESDALKSEKHILKGLMISGMPKEDANRLIQHLRDA